MIRRHVLAALHAGVAAGDDEVAREVLLETEWILRGAARRRLERALLDAIVLTGEGFSSADRESVRHVQRVAALDVAGSAGKLTVEAAQSGPDIRDREAVAAHYELLAPRPPSRAPVITTLTAVSLIGMLALLVWTVVRVRTPERPTRGPIPLPAGAYFTGGTPAYDDAIAQFLETELTQLVIETDLDRQGSSKGAGRAARVKVLRDSPVIVSRGPGLATAWRAMIDALDRWVDISVHDRNFQPAIKELGRRAHDVSEQFAALGLGYYISADVMIRGSIARAAMFSYRVEEVAFVRAAGDARRVLSLRRLDKLNLDLALLGRQGDELGDPVVLLDQVDNLVEDRVLPVLARETYRLGDPSWRRSSHSGRMLAASAADAIERELRVALGTDVADPELRVRRARQIVAATVRRHEARHGIDNERTRPLRYPQALASLVGARTAATLRVELELSAYLSQIANDPVTPHFTLWNLAGHAFNTRWGSAESFVATLILEGLARQLGHAPTSSVVIAGRLDREMLAKLARPIALVSDDNLRAAARTLWLELYGEPVLPIVDLQPRL